MYLFPSHPALQVNTAPTSTLQYEDAKGWSNSRLIVSLGKSWIRSFKYLAYFAASFFSGKRSGDYVINARASPLPHAACTVFLCLDHLRVMRVYLGL